MITRVSVVLSILALVTFKECEPANILVVAPFFGASHSTFIHSVMTHVARKGHSVTIITTNLEKNPPPNYNQIQITEKIDMSQLAVDNIFSIVNETAFEHIIENWRKSNIVSRMIMETGTLKNFIENDKSQFDLVVVEHFYQEHMFMFSHKYKAPLALISSSTYNQHLFEMMGSYLPYSYVPNDMFRSGAMSGLYQRVLNVILSMFSKIGRQMYHLSSQQKIAEEYFKELPHPLPSLKELEKSISMVILNTHFSCDMVVPSVSGIVEVAGAHIKPAKKLPQDIQSFLDGAKNGAILFALGSHILSSKIQQDKLNGFIKVFDELNLRVVWKWEGNDPPKDKNIYTSKWLPQYDVLGHPNIRAFINHGGKLSLLEAMYQGVPVIGVPIFADQFVNVENLAEKGAAIPMDYNQINEVTLKDILEKIIKDPSFKLSASKISEKIKDRPESPLDKAVYWIEYVIKHKQENLLNSPLSKMPWYTYYMLDVSLVFAGILLLILTLLCTVKRVIKNMLCKKQDMKIKNTEKSLKQKTDKKRK